MAATIKLFSAIVLLFLLQEGHAQCSLSDITVSQAATGSSVEGVPEYKVTITNGCICSQSNLIVACSGFDSKLPVEPKVFRSSESGRCIVSDGQPVFSGQPVEFTYTSKPQPEMEPISSTINCS